MRVLQHGEGLTRERDAMRAAHLHALWWDRPNGRLEIDLRPLGATQFTGPDESKGKQLEAIPDFGSPVVPVDRPQQAAKPLGINDSGAMPDDWGGKRPSERRRRVAYRSSCGDRIAKDRADSRTQPPRALPPPVRFDAAKHLQNFGSRNLCDRPRSEGGVGHADKFGRNYAEGVGLLVGLRELSELLLLARVEAIAELALGLLPARSGVLQRKGWIGSDRELPLFSSESIGKIPEFSAARRHP